MNLRLLRRFVSMILIVVVHQEFGPASAQNSPQEDPARRDDAARDLPQPKDVPQFELSPLPTIPTRRSLPGPTWTALDTVALPRDREGIWILEFAFKPVRLIEVELPGKGRKKVFYMYYKVVNRTGEDRRFVPQFTLVTDTGQSLEDVVLPLAVRKIQAKEDPSKRLLGAVEIMGLLPASTKEDVDDAVYGVAIWEDVDLKSDSFSIYVRGLSDGTQIVEGDNDQPPIVRHKTVRIDFARPGDERRPGSREIYLKEPPYEWIYTSTDDIGS